MPIVEIAPGKFVNFEEGTPQRVIDDYARRNAKSTPVSKPRTSIAPTNPNADIEQDVQRQLKARAATGLQSSGRKYLDQLGRGLLYNFDDEISGAANAAVMGLPADVFSGRAFKGDFSSTKRQYRIGKEVTNRENRDFENRNPLTSAAAQIGGAMLAPVPPVAKIAGKVAPKLANAAPRAASAIAKTADYAATRGPIARAAMQGASAGALSAAGAQDGSIAKRLSAAGAGSLTGAAGGAAFGGAAMLPGAVRRIIGSHGKGAADDVAYARVAEMLDNAPQTPNSTLMHTPATARAEIQASRAQGVNATLGELSPEMQTAQGYLARQPRLRGGNQLNYQGREVLDNIGDRFGTKVDEVLAPAQGRDTHALKTSIRNERLAKGKEDYKTLDEPIYYWQNMDDLIKSNNPLVKDGLRNAVQKVLKDDKNPTEIGFDINEAGELIKFRHPTLRTFEYIRRGLNEVAQDAKAAGKFDDARMASNKVEELRGLIAEANPKITEAIAHQRSFFEKEAAIDFGKAILTKSNKEPGKMLSEMDRLPSNVMDDFRSGVVEHLLSLRSTRTNPTIALKRYMADPNKRQILEKVMGSRKNVNELYNWLNREMRHIGAAQKTAGNQSITSDILMMNKADDVGDVSSQLAQDSAAGGAFGGVLGATRNAWRRLDIMTRTMSKEAKEKLAQILMGDASDIEQGINKAREGAKVHARKQMGRAERYGKTGGYLMGLPFGGSE